jgi:general secretion pathway protein K
MIKNAFRILKNRTGIAIITAILALAFMTYLATEVTYDATIEYLVNSQELKRLKAYYAARSGVEISLLRIKAYQQVAQKLGKNAGNYPMINMIWTFPLQFPLQIPEKMGLMTKDEFKEANESSFFDANIDTQISDEGSKLDLNDLVSPSKVLRDSTRKLLTNLFAQEIESNKAFESKYRNFQFEELINQIADFMSDKRGSLNGGDKTAAYKDEYQGYPPNRAFRTVSELRILPLMDEQIFKFLENKVTVFGLKGINPNTASKEVLMSIDAEIKAEVADKLINRRNTESEGGQFKSATDFWAAAEQFGARISKETKDQTPIVTDTLISFRIKSTGVYGNVRTQIEAVVSDIDKTASRVADYVKNETPPPSPGTAPSAPAPAPPPAAPIAPGPPRILYWIEY